jgi:hypothetical protein
LEKSINEEEDDEQEEINEGDENLNQTANSESTELTEPDSIDGLLKQLSLK